MRHRLAIVTLALVCVAGLSSTADAKRRPPPTIVGAPTVGVQLAANVATASRRVLTIQWMRCAGAPSTRGSCRANRRIARGMSYTTRSSDVGSYLRIRVRLKAAGAGRRGRIVTSRWVGPIREPADAARLPQAGEDAFGLPAGVSGGRRDIALAYGAAHTLLDADVHGVIEESWSIRLDDYVANANALVAAIDPFAELDPGMRWLRFRVTLSNTGDGVQTGGTDNVVLFTSDGDFYSSTQLIGDGAELGTSKLVEPGATITGYIYFQIPVTEPADGPVAFSFFGKWERNGRYLALH